MDIDPSQEWIGAGIVSRGLPMGIRIVLNPRTQSSVKSATGVNYLGLKPTWKGAKGSIPKLAMGNLLKTAMMQPPSREITPSMNPLMSLS